MPNLPNIKVAIIRRIDGPPTLRFMASTKDGRGLFMRVVVPNGVIERDVVDELTAIVGSMNSADLPKRMKVQYSDGHWRLGDVALTAPGTDLE